MVFTNPRDALLGADKYCAYNPLSPGLPSVFIENKHCYNHIGRVEVHELAKSYLHYNNSCLDFAAEQFHETDK